MIFVRFESAFPRGLKVVLLVREGRRSRGDAFFARGASDRERRFWGRRKLNDVLQGYGKPTKDDFTCMKKRRYKFLTSSINGNKCKWRSFLAKVAGMWCRFVFCWNRHGVKNNVFVKIQKILTIQKVPKNMPCFLCKEHKIRKLLSMLEKCEFVFADKGGR